MYYSTADMDFMFLSDELLTLETLDFTIRIGNTVHQPFYISICIWTLPTQHTMFISLIQCSLFAGYIAGSKFRKAEISGNKQANSLKHPMSRFKQKQYTPRKKDEGLLWVRLCQVFVPTQVQGRSKEQAAIISKQKASDKRRLKFFQAVNYFRRLIISGG